MNAVAAAGNTDTVTAPSIAYHALWPILIVLGVACVGVLVEAVVPRAERFAVQVGLSLLGLVTAFVAVVLNHNTNLTTVAGALAVDKAGLFIQGTIVLLAILSVLLMAERNVETGGAIVAQAAVVAGSPRDRELARSDRVQTEVFPLAMFAVGGMLVFAISNNLLLMFVALEVLSLPLYLMAGLARRRRLLSQEAAMKYFLLGAFASAFFLYGLALLYGYADSVDLATILRSTSTSNRPELLLYLGLGLLIVGLLFKAGIAPFHSWTPDVYQGAPTPVTAFMASCTKVAAFGAIMRVLYVGFSSTQWDWRPVIWAVAIASMVVGAVFGLTQTDVKRILSYSSIAHAGFILVGLVAVTSDGISSVLFYLVTYGFATVAAFGLVMLVRDGNGEATHLSQWSGLAKKSPIVAVTMTVLLLSMAGIPLTAGFVGKFVVFRAAYHVAGPLVVIALLSSAVAAFFYLRIVVLMFFAEPPEDGPTVAIPSPVTGIALTIGVAVTIVLGLFPQPILDLARHAAFLQGVTPSPIGVEFADAALEASVRTRLDEVEDALRVAVATDDEFLAVAGAYLVEAGGKQFRPLVTVLASHFGHADVPQIVPAAVVVELTHLATLYHDDVMDEARVRRGAVSANARWNNTVAILTGDFLFARASDVLADLGPWAVRVQARTFERLVAGQIHETRGPAAGSDPIAHYLGVLADKTGSLIATSAEFGARFAGGDESTVGALRRYGEAIGVAFQLSDDILDIASDTTESGKTPGTDLREGVATLPALYALRSAEPSSARLRALLGHPLVDDAEHAEALRLLRASDGVSEARETLRLYADRARSELASLPRSPAQAGFEALTYFVVERTG